MRVAAFAAQLGALGNPKPVLLIDYHQPEIRELNLLLNERLRSDDDLNRINAQPVVNLPLLRFRRRAEKQANRVIVPQQFGNAPIVLLGQYRGGRHERGLRPRAHCNRHRQRGHHRFAGTDVTLQQAVHRRGAGHVGADVGHRALLRAREHVRQRAGQRIQCFVEDDQRLCGFRFPLRPLPLHAQLQQQHLVERQPFARRRQLLLVVGEVNLQQRVAVRHQFGA